MDNIFKETNHPSASSPDTVVGSHDLVVTGYSLSKGIGMGKYIASDTFMVGGYAWAIYYYPDGKNAEDNATYVSLFIVLASEGTDVRALFELTLLDQSGKERHMVHTHFDRPLEGGPYSLKFRGSMWGFKRFIERTALETSDYLKDDCLKVRCRVGVVTSQAEGRRIYPTPLPPSSDMDLHVGQLLESLDGTHINDNDQHVLDLWKKICGGSVFSCSMAGRRFALRDGGRAVVSKP